MDPDLYPEAKSIHGIDLSHYYIDKSSYNPIVYIHKKYLPKTTNEAAVETSIKNPNNDKCEQFDYDKLHTETYKPKIVTEHQDTLVDQTIQFAKNIIPITIPPSTDMDNPCYYIVNSKKMKRKHEQQPIVCDKDDKLKNRQTLNTKFRKCTTNKDSLSNMSETPNNTTDDVTENHSLSYNSMSEISEEKAKKQVYVDKDRKNNARFKLVASESFEAIATECNTSGGSKIKIHLMNEDDKNFLYENIRTPVVMAIKECFHELNTQNEPSKEIQNINKVMKCHAKKLDNILEKLTCIENKLELLSKPQKNSKIEIIKASKLEELGKDVAEYKEESSEEELACVNYTSKSRGKNTPVTPMYSETDAEKDNQSDNLAKGENVPEYFKPSTSQLGLRPERSSRLPARFCWTDTVMK